MTAVGEYAPFLVVEVVACASFHRISGAFSLKYVPQISFSAGSAHGKIEVVDETRRLGSAVSAGIVSVDHNDPYRLRSIRNLKSIRVLTSRVEACFILADKELPLVAGEVERTVEMNISPALGVVVYADTFFEIVTLAVSVLAGTGVENRPEQRPRWIN